MDGWMDKGVLNLNLTFVTVNLQTERVLKKIKRGYEQNYSDECFTTAE